MKFKSIPLLSIVLLFSFSLFVSCSIKEETEEQVTRSVIGLWTGAATGTTCSETRTFNDNSTFAKTSDFKIQGGTYIFETTVAKDSRHSLTLSVASDNALADCTGSTANSAGDTDTFYLEFSDDSNFAVYSSSSGGTAIASLSKQ